MKKLTEVQLRRVVRKMISEQYDILHDDNDFGENFDDDIGGPNDAFGFDAEVDDFDARRDRDAEMGISPKDRRSIGTRGEQAYGKGDWW